VSEYRYIFKVHVVLGGLVVAYLPLDVRFADSTPTENEEFLRTIRIRSTTSFGEELKPEVLHKINNRLKNLRSMKEIFHIQNSAAISHQVSLLRYYIYLLVIAREL
jgi:hypothetical protein